MASEVALYSRDGNWKGVIEAWKNEFLCTARTSSRRPLCDPCVRTASGTGCHPTERVGRWRQNDPVAEGRYAGNIAAGASRGAHRLASGESPLRGRLRKK